MYFRQPLHACRKGKVFRGGACFNANRLIPFILFGLFLSGGSYGQNLILNSGFESNNAVPNGYGQWYNCQGWSNVNNYIGFAWPYASPDYLRTGAGGGVGLPNSTFGTVNPYAGNAVMGFIAYYGPSPDFREYLARPLISPMVPGQAYTISFYMTNGMSNWYSGAGCNHVGVRFSNGPLTQLNHEPLNIIPHCEITTKWWSTSWQLVSFTYIPSVAYNYMTIGNFYNDAATAHAMYGTGADGAYYFIDEVTVAPAVPLPVQWLHFDGRSTTGGILLEWTTASEFNTDYFIAERSADALSFSDIGRIPAAGTSIKQNDYSLLDPVLPASTRYYRLRLVDRDGTESVSGIVAIEPPQNSRFYLYNDQEDRQKVYGHLPSEMKDASLRVFNSLGEMRFERKIAGQDFEVSLLNPGVYFFSVFSPGMTDSRKWIVSP